MQPACQLSENAWPTMPTGFEGLKRLLFATMEGDRIRALCNAMSRSGQPPARHSAPGRSSLPERQHRVAQPYGNAPPAAAWQRVLLFCHRILRGGRLRGIVLA
jgi:hypothetical protein